MMDKKMFDRLSEAGFEFGPYIYQCEADKCIMPSRDIGPDTELRVHPECRVNILPWNRRPSTFSGKETGYGFDD